MEFVIFLNHYILSKKTLASTSDPPILDMDKQIQEVKRLADFQMRKSTHIRFLENCIAEPVVPKGLRMNLEVQVGANDRLQKAVNSVLEKTSLEICRLVKEEHMMQPQESKGKMAGLENKLRSDLSDEGKFNELMADIFTATENKKNKIIVRQNSKLEKLQCARDIIIVEDDPPSSGNGSDQTDGCQRKTSAVKRKQNTRYNQQKSAAPAQKRLSPKHRKKTNSEYQKPSVDQPKQAAQRETGNRGI